MKTRNHIRLALALALAMLGALPTLAGAQQTAESLASVRYRTVEVDGMEIFYREAGSRENPTILLLHGFPTSSHMFRELMPALADEYHLVAPDYPGFGHSPMPKVDEFEYTPDTSRSKRISNSSARESAPSSQGTSAHEQGQSHRRHRDQQWAREVDRRNPRGCGLAGVRHNAQFERLEP